MNNLLFERILQEANKTRFIDKAFEAFYGPNFKEREDLTLEDMEYDKIVKFVNSGAADKYKIDWNEKNYMTLFTDILYNYDKYIKSGGSIAQRKKARNIDPKKIFINNVDLIEGKDYIFLPELEDDKYFFIQPLSYECCKFMDDARCGGQGAKWCLGWVKSDYHWKLHAIDKGELFVFVFNKKEFKNSSNEPDKLKYMLDLSQNRCNTELWFQTDIPEETLKIIDLFNENIDINNILKIVLNKNKWKNIVDSKYIESWNNIKEQLNKGKDFYERIIKVENAINVNDIFYMGHIKEDVIKKVDELALNSNSISFNFAGCERYNQYGFYYPLNFLSLNLNRFKEVKFYNFSGPLYLSYTFNENLNIDSKDRINNKLSFYNCALKDIYIENNFLLNCGRLFNFDFNESVFKDIIVLVNNDTIDYRNIISYLNYIFNKNTDETMAVYYKAKIINQKTGEEIEIEFN